MDRLVTGEAWPQVGVNMQIVCVHTDGLQKSELWVFYSVYNLQFSRYRFNPCDPVFKCEAAIVAFAKASVTT